MKDVVTVDTELSAWLICRMMRMQLSVGLPYSSVRRWAVCIDSAVGEPFLSTWKNYPVGVVRQHQSVLSAADRSSGGTISFPSIPQYSHPARAA